MEETHQVQMETS
jgi:hypothetical protein